jgi:type IV secretory pathway TrbD component
VVRDETSRGIVLLTGTVLIAALAIYLFARWLQEGPGLSVTASIVGILVVAISAAAALLLRFFSRERK